MVPGAVKSEDPINAAGDGTGIIAQRGQADTTVVQDAAPGRQIRQRIAPPIHRCQVERAKEAPPCGLEGIFDHDGFRNSAKHPIDLPTAAVCADNEPQVRVVVAFVGQQPLQHIKKAAVKGRFAPQQADAFPFNSHGQAFPDKGFDRVGRDFNITGSLGAGTVAVSAFQIAPVSQIDFNEPAASSKWTAQPSDKEFLAPDLLVKIKDQALKSDVAVDFDAVHVSSDILSAVEKAVYGRPQDSMIL